MTAPDARPHRKLPRVDAILDHPRVRELADIHGRVQARDWVRQALDELRQGGQADIESAGDIEQRVVDAVVARAEADASRQFRKVLNATGVILHTNLGRAPLADAATRAMIRAAGYTNLELDLETGERSERGYQVEPLLNQLTGAAATLVVNNCAAATLLTLKTLAEGREVVVSRGQLVEIGGSYRLPDIFAISGAVLREVGTTNRTRVADYEQAITESTAALLRVHPSNYRIEGYSESVDIGPLAELAHRRGLLCIDDIGSGAMIDPMTWGASSEPSPARSLRDGADLVLYSGDKLLGGPQAGIIQGRENLIKRLRKSPLARAVRVNKSTLAGLEATLELYRRGVADDAIPVLRAARRTQVELAERAEKLMERLSQVKGVEIRLAGGESTFGGGSLPGAVLPTMLLTVAPGARGADERSRRLRLGAPAVVARIIEGEVVFDLRCVEPADDDSLAQAIADAWNDANPTC